MKLSSAQEEMFSQYKTMTKKEKEEVRQIILIEALLAVAENDRDRLTFLKDVTSLLVGKKRSKKSK